MFSRVEYTDNRNGNRMSTHLVGDTEEDIIARLYNLCSATDRNMLTIHSINPEQPDFMQHEFDALSESIGKSGTSADVMILKILGDILVTMKEILREQREISDGMRFITSHIDGSATG